MAHVDTIAAQQRELDISIWQGDSVQYEGSAAQLKAEGLIPRDFDDIEWPRADEPQCWQVGGFDYILVRQRPAGRRGPWTTWDNWWLRVSVTGKRNRQLRAKDARRDDGGFQSFLRSLMPAEGARNATSTGDQQ